MILPLILHRTPVRFYIALAVVVSLVTWWAGPLSAETLLPHPRGCPAKRFCGCGAAVEIFGKPIRSLWPSSAWFKFPRTSPRPNTVAVRRGHVFTLKRHVRGKVWMVIDHNSGKNRSRYHARSIAGYTIVNPYASNVAMGE